MAGNLSGAEKTVGVKKGPDYASVNGHVVKGVRGEKSRIFSPPSPPSAIHDKKERHPRYREGEVFVKFKKHVKAKSALSNMLATGQMRIKKRFNVLSRKKNRDLSLIHI